MKCDNCINSRPIISENGIHYHCCLSHKKTIECLTERKDHLEAVDETWSEILLELEKLKQEREERSEGCEYCWGSKYLDWELFIDNGMIVAGRYSEPDSYANINFCPMCGRPLKGADNETD